MHENFKGFSIPSGFTQTPNEFYDLIMRNELSLIEIRLLSFMMRFTFGWRKDGYCLQFSLNDLVKYLGFDKKQASNAIKQCTEKGYIEQNNLHGHNFYRLVMDETTQVEWTYDFDWKKVVNWGEIDNPSSKKDNRGSKKDNPGGQIDNPGGGKDNPGGINDNTGSEKATNDGVKLTTEGSQNHPDEVGKSTTPESPSAQAGQGSDDALNKSINILDFKDSRNRSFEEEDEESIYSQMGKDCFIEEVSSKIRLPQAFTDKVLKEIEWDKYTPVAVQRAAVKFRQGFKTGKIDKNPFVWFKSTLDNEEVLYTNEFYNMR
ncbi:helix-turn-helix domain-containing protein (plasmid) [Paenibacillus rhizovicinus]|uniref:Helix-turn-helix domain-containing protein n=1 Tax=Paenibacillus rhizovicinus TaxID=2704463 RepID=A0A6C0PBC1_9BACL|nr:helix-turn-helix domain-containing protein [Paenibacillus rhizovicinus]QHW35818.1 helix-turn-helix domain-containing protein [Paenibacillus rhizovicinus]